jgi:type I restriction enzyme, S subunit
MKVKPGYKQTEIGVIPEDWEVKCLSALAKILSGGTPNTTNLQFWDGDIHWCTPTDITALNGFKYINNTNRKITSLGLTSSAAEILPPYSIIMTSRATIGACAINTVPICTNQGFKNFIPFETIDTEFLYYLLLTQKNNFIHLCGGSTFLEINKKQLSGLKIQLPQKKEEQTAIATVLSDVDALLNALEQLIAKKRNIKQATMQQLLTGQTRLPGFHGEWEVKQLGKLGVTYSGLVNKIKADFGKGEGQYITFMNVLTNVIINPTLFEQVNILRTESQNHVINGDLLFNGSSETPEELGMPALLTVDIPRLYLNSFCFGFRLYEHVNIDKLFLTYYLRSQVGRTLIKSLAQGSTRYNLSKVTLLKSLIHLPSLAEQTAIATILSDIDSELAALEEQLAKTRALKLAIMQELLTGKTRLIATGETNERTHSNRKRNTKTHCQTIHG